MSDLILHVGPGKCGSTSIQSVFKRHRKPCEQKTHFEVVDPGLISRLDRERPDMSELAVFEKRLSGQLNRYEAVILSHEYFFDCPHAILHVCRIAKDLGTQATIIGYCRRQSDFSVSVYSQWLFRSAERVSEVTGVLKDLGLDPFLFSGLERQLIAAVATDFHSIRQLSGKSILDWHKSYQDLTALVRETDALVHCGQLPRRGSDKSLIQDFCEKAGLTLHKNTVALGNKVDNVRFDHDLIEAINNALLLGLDVPGPHERNEDLEAISAQMTRMSDPEIEFITDLKTYIDTYFLPSNIRLCNEYHLSKEYFSPSGQSSKAEVMDRIKSEAHNRAADSTEVINRLRMLSARAAATCLAMTKKKRPSSQIGKFFKHLK